MAASTTIHENKRTSYEQHFLEYNSGKLHSNPITAELPQNYYHHTSPSPNKKEHTTTQHHIFIGYTLAFSLLVSIMFFNYFPDVFNSKSFAVFLSTIFSSLFFSASQHITKQMHGKQTDNNNISSTQQQPSVMSKTYNVAVRYQIVQQHQQLVVHQLPPSLRPKLPTPPLVPLPYHSDASQLIPLFDNINLG